MSSTQFPSLVKSARPGTGQPINAASTAHSSPPQTAFSSQLSHQGSLSNIHSAAAPLINSTNSKRSKNGSIGLQPIQFNSPYHSLASQHSQQQQQPQLQSQSQSQSSLPHVSSHPQLPHSHSQSQLHLLLQSQQPPPQSQFGATAAVLQQLPQFNGSGSSVQPQSAFGAPLMPLQTLQPLSTSSSNPGLPHPQLAQFGSLSQSHSHSQLLSQPIMASGTPTASVAPKAVKVGLSPGETLRKYGEFLTPFEQSEILEYQQIYFVGNTREKLRGVPHSPNNSGYDDERGDYRCIVGDHLEYRYELLSLLGRGSFGQVLKVYDHKKEMVVALKIIRNKKRFHHQALVEVKILEHIMAKDREHKSNIVRVYGYFYFRNHLCITFEPLSINLYEFIKNNNFRGVSLALIRRFAIQLLTALKFLKQEQIIHSDLKPENVLLRAPNKSTIKLIDFGSSCFVQERVYTYIQSRFYRSPEVILGLPYDTAIDMWSFGAILCELYSGYPIFPGENEMEQLACIMEILGPPPTRLIKESPRRKNFFDTQGKPILVPNSRGKLRQPGTKDLAAALKCSDPFFLSFIRKCLRWDPKARLTPDRAFEHPFIDENAAAQATAAAQANGGIVSLNYSSKGSANSRGPRASSASKSKSRSKGSQNSQSGMTDAIANLSARATPSSGKKVSSTKSNNNFAFPPIQAGAGTGSGTGSSRGTNQNSPSHSQRSSASHAPSPKVAPSASSSVPMPQLAHSQSHSAIAGHSLNPLQHQPSSRAIAFSQAQPQWSSSSNGGSVPQSAFLNSFGASNGSAGESMDMSG